MFFLKQLFRDYEVHHKVVLLVFSVTFALSCLMFELIIFEILGFMDTRFVTILLTLKVPKTTISKHC